MAEQCAEERKKKKRRGLVASDAALYAFVPSVNEPVRLYGMGGGGPEWASPTTHTTSADRTTTTQHGGQRTAATAAAPQQASKATMPIAARRPAHNPRMRDTSGPITPARRRLKNGKQPSICPARIPTPSLADYPSTPSCRTNRPPRPVVLRPKSAAARQHVAHSLSQRGSPSARG